MLVTKPNGRGSDPFNKFPLSILLYFFRLAFLSISFKMKTVNLLLCFFILLTLNGCNTNQKAENENAEYLDSTATEQGDPEPTSELTSAAQNLTTLLQNIKPEGTQVVSKSESDGDGMSSTGYNLFVKDDLALAEVESTGPFYYEAHQRYFLQNRKLIKIEKSSKSYDLVSADNNVIEETKLEYIFEQGKFIRFNSKSKTTPITDLEHPNEQVTGFDDLPFQQKNLSPDEINKLRKELDNLLLDLGSYGTLVDVYGIGVLTVSCKDREVKFYDQENSDKEALTLVINNGLITNSNKPDPIVSSTEYDLLHFKILETGNNRILVEYQPDPWSPYTLWLDKNLEGTAISNPTEYIQGYTMISVQSYVNPVRATPMMMPILL